jgi:hypothetical protein
LEEDVVVFGRFAVRARIALDGGYAFEKFLLFDFFFGEFF